MALDHVQVTDRLGRPLPPKLRDQIIESDFAFFTEAPHLSSTGKHAFSRQKLTQLGKVLYTEATFGEMLFALRCLRSERTSPNACGTNRHAPSLLQRPRIDSPAHLSESPIPSSSYGKGTKIPSGR